MKSTISFTSSEFCGEKNEDVDMALEGVPDTSTTDYLLEPAEEEEEEEKEGKEDGSDNEVDGKKEKGASKPSGRRNNLVIFAVDVSGSMCTTTEVPELQGTFYTSVTFYGNIL